MDIKTHWEKIYQTRQPTEVSWYQPTPALSLELIRQANPGRAARIIDVGGGASTLVDCLLKEGNEAVTVLDISSAALEAARRRLGSAAQAVTWLEADVTQADLPPGYFDIWHDRAVFHFLTQAEQRRRYVEVVKRAVKAGGHVIVATFADDGPDKCSGLRVAQYSPQALHAEFGPGFQLVDSRRENHHTPFGTEQKFVYCCCRRL